MHACPPFSLGLVLIVLRLPLLPRCSAKASSPSRSEAKQDVKAEDIEDVEAEMDALLEELGTDPLGD